MQRHGIHPTAQVGERVRLGHRVTVAAYAIIEDDVDLGDDCDIGPHAVIHSQTHLAAGNRVSPHAVLGGAPQDLTFDPATMTRLEIGPGNVFREGVTVSRGSAASGATRIGEGGYFMNNAHIAHDCRVGDRVIMASGVALGGHVEVGDRVFIGGGAMVHQFCRVGRLAIIAGLAAVRQDVMPFSMIAGDPAKHYRLNTLGLRRAGFDERVLRLLSRAYRRVRDDADRRLDGFEDGADTESIAQLREWLQAPSKRGICGYVKRPARRA